MVPLIVGGVVIAAAAASAFRAFKVKCRICDSRWTSNQSCLVCGCQVCSGCGRQIETLGRCCPIHGNIDRALHDAETVEVFSKNYRGKTPEPQFSETLKTASYESRDHAEHALRFLAALRGCQVVQDVHELRGTEKSDNYIHSVWTFTGVI